MASRDTTPVVQARQIAKSYLGATVLQAVSVDIMAGFTALIGPSGSGKTTLLNQMMAIDRPDRGSITVDGVEITALSDAQRTRWRAGTGRIFQRSGLVAGLTAIANIVDPHILTGRRVDHDWVDYLLRRLDVADVATERAGRLSGGQQQRIAMIRALAHRPSIVFADEPTANLDTAMKTVAHAFLAEMAHAVPVVVVSHDAMTPDYADRVIVMRDGKIGHAGADAAVPVMSGSPPDRAVPRWPPWR